MLTNFRSIRMLMTVAISLSAAGCKDNPATAPFIPVEPPIPVTTSPQREIVPFVWTPGEGMREIPLPAEATRGEATGINYDGEVVGWYMRSDGDPQAFMWSEQRGFRIIRVVIDMQGDLTNVALYPLAINDHGQILFDGGYFGSFVWDEGKVDFIEQYRSRFTAHGFNNSGQVAGEEIIQVAEPGFEGADPNFADGDIYKDVSRPFVWSPTTGLKYLPSTTSDARTAAVAINDNGLVVGYSGVATRDRVRNSDPLMWGDADDLPAKLSTRSSDSACTTSWAPTSSPRNPCAALATAVNNAGEIAGTIDRHAFRWSEEKRLSMLPGSDEESYATGINSSGDIVGFTYSVAQSDAFIWRRSGAVEKIGTLPGRWWSIAKAVNDRGQVVGNAQ